MTGFDQLLQNYIKYADSNLLRDSKLNKSNSVILIRCEMPPSKVATARRQLDGIQVYGNYEGTTPASSLGVICGLPMYFTQA